MKIGRNEPCPCGSGKKYKNCCLNRKVEISDLSFDSESKDFLLKRPTKDYGPPKLSKYFFDKNQVKEISAARLLYSNLLNPGIEELASKTTRQFVIRGREEAKRISRETNPENLLKMMDPRTDTVNHWLLKKKILKFANFAIPRIIEKLKDNIDDTFVELAIGIIYESKIDYSSQLLEILDSIKESYTLSLACLLLGFIAPKEAIQPVWNYYHFLKEEYPRETYEQGPLLALYEFKERFGLN